MFVLYFGLIDWIERHYILIYMKYIKPQHDLNHKYKADKFLTIFQKDSLSHPSFPVRRQPFLYCLRFLPAAMPC